MILVPEFLTHPILSASGHLHVLHSLPGIFPDAPTSHLIPLTSHPDGLLPSL